jgi:rRNA pseudouridine-1189 N-methylase Emg1 (Nep1/Mra1 family)
MLARLQEASDNVKIWDSNLQDGRTNLPALKRKMEDAKQARFDICRISLLYVLFMADVVCEI